MQNFLGKTPKGFSETLRTISSKPVMEISDETLLEKILKELGEKFQVKWEELRRSSRKSLGINYKRSQCGDIEKNLGEFHKKLERNSRRRSSKKFGDIFRVKSLEHSREIFFNFLMTFYTKKCIRARFRGE